MWLGYRQIGVVDWGFVASFCRHRHEKEDLELWLKLQPSSGYHRHCADSGFRVRLAATRLRHTVGLCTVHTSSVSAVSARADVGFRRGHRQHAATSTFQWTSQAYPDLVAQETHNQQTSEGALNSSSRLHEGSDTRCRCACRICLEPPAIALPFATTMSSFPSRLRPEYLSAKS